MRPYLISFVKAISTIYPNSVSYCQDKSIPSLYKLPLLDRRKLLGLDAPPPALYQPLPQNDHSFPPTTHASIVSYVQFPLGVIQNNHEFYPVILEEASVVAGATGMLKLLNETFAQIAFTFHVIK